MSETTHIVGVDPGIVHTGVVSMLFMPKIRKITVKHEVVLGPNAQMVADAIRNQLGGLSFKPRVFIEGYRPRHHMQHDSRMQRAVAELVAATGGKALDNTGVKKIVLPPVMRTLGVWRYSTPTHHDDLRSAARIALLGMYKDPGLNLLIATVIRDELDQKPWSIISN